MADAYFTVMESPLGELVLTSDGVALTGLYTPGNDNYVKARTGVESIKPFVKALRQLNEYFAGKRTEFDLPMAANGTEFQQKVWARLQKIKYGETKSYGQIAAELGMPAASRAIGAANGRNPICIIVPCHRVIGANGSLTGYNGGLGAKEWLLEHEGK
jgi:methylated-DNA-[protein]-cysteine S-methyltransferase